MNDILKQRLVGALILLALGVVFWPIIFVEPGEGDSDEARGIPPRPGISREAVPEPDAKSLRQSPAPARAEEVEVAPPPKPQAKPQPAPEVAKPVVAKPTPKPAPPPGEKKTRTEAPVKPKLDADGVPIAWKLQVASVSNPQKAEELRKKLLAMGHKAYVKKIRRGDDVLLRVYIGPKFEKAPLEKIQKSIDETFKVDSVINRYYP